MHPTRSCLLPQTFVLRVFFLCLPVFTKPLRPLQRHDVGNDKKILAKCSLVSFRELDDKIKKQSICSLWWIWSYTSQRQHTHTPLAFFYGSTNQIPSPKVNSNEKKRSKRPFLKTDTSLQKVFETKTLTFFNKSEQTWKEPVPDSLFFIEIWSYSQQPLA